MQSQTNHIQEIALQALQSINCSYPPVPIEEVAKKLGFAVVEFDFPNSISGVLKKDRMVIGVNAQHHPIRRRFTIAHELGHFLLGHDIGKEEDVVDEDFDKPIHTEKQANIFASCILMPSEWVKSEVQGKTIDLKVMAQKFSVSEQAITIRLLELNLIK